MKIKIFLSIFLSVLSFTFLTGQTSSKKLTISGFVLDSSQKPVSGAMIFIDNRRTNVTTNAKGFFKIKVNQQAKTISVLTLANGLVEAEIGGRTTINFSLKTADLSSKNQVQNPADDETINVGYGTIKKKNLTTQVGKIDGTNKNYASYQNIYEMMQGVLPGVHVVGKSILIQGPSSINSSNEPLLVVDGIIFNSIEDISPRDVKSIEVLKGAAASIYGSRGSNGVIMIYLKSAADYKK
jgi:TonB-dependent SusC/RagA subfamily outer membrane receptor